MSAKTEFGLYYFGWTITVFVIGFLVGRST